MPLFHRTLPISALLALFTALLQAQFETATVLGTVKDPSQGRVAGATVVLENLDTGIRDKTAADSSGDYQFLTVKIGRYQVRVEAAGFRAADSEPFEVATGAHQRVDMTLQVGTATETVTVSGAASQLETDSSDRGQVVRSAEIEALPLNGRAYADLALLAPGVRRSSISTTRDASFNVNGQRSYVNSFTLDGVDNDSYANSNQGFSNQVVQPSPDALAEFKVQTDNYSAEYGRASGAVINASIRSGTNELHGALWEFIRNTDLNAAGFFHPTYGKPTLVQNQFGFTAGGPIIKNRTFFFADYEGFRSVSRTLSWQTLPTADQRAGVFTMPIYDIRGATVLPNNIVPASYISSFARQVVNDLPAANVNVAGSSLNYQLLPRASSFNDKGDVKIDHRFSDRFNMFARLSQRKVNSYVPPAIAGPDGIGMAYFIRVLNQAVLSANYLAGPRTLFEVRFGYTRTVAGSTPDGIGGPNMYQLYGISGLPTDPHIAGGLYGVSLTSYPGWGRSGSYPQSQSPAVKNPKVSVSHILGSHTIKAGYEWQQDNMELDDFNPKYGKTTYTGQWSKPSSASSNYVYTFSDFLLGNMNSYYRSTSTVANSRQQMQFAYVQDDWKVNSRLTLNLGLRYEYGTPPYERDIDGARTRDLRRDRHKR